MKPKSTVLSTKRLAFAVCYIFLHILVVPSLLIDGNEILKQPLSRAKLNVLFDVINFTVVLLLMFPLLFEDLKKALAKPFSCIWRAILCFCVYFAVMTGFTWFMQKFYPTFSNVNDAQTLALLSQEYTLMKLCTVILVPVTEELLYRGAVFGALRKYPPAVPFAVSTLLFGAIHVVSYIGSYPWQQLLICFLQYLPAGLCLCWAYYASGTVWTNILMHMAVNEVAMLLLR